MNAEAIATLGALVVVLTQITKRLLPGEGWGPYAALCWSIVGVMLWCVSQPILPMRTDIFTIFAGLVSVTATAMGIYSASGMVTGLSQLVSKPPAWLPPDDQERR